MEERRWTPETVDRLRDAVAVLRDIGVRSVLGIGPDGAARCRVLQEHLAELARMLGRRPDIRPAQYGGGWDAEIDLGGVAVMATFGEFELPLIGYKVTPPPPRPYPMPQPIDDWLAT